MRRSIPFIAMLVAFNRDGGYGTSAYTDPQNALIGVLMTQRLMDSPEPPPTCVDFWTAACASADTVP